MKQGVFIWSIYVVLKAGKYTWAIIRDGCVHGHELFMEFLFICKESYNYLVLTLSMLHMTTVAISRLVEKVLSLELLHATDFSMRLV